MPFKNTVQHIQSLQLNQQSSPRWFSSACFCVTTTSGWCISGCTDNCLLVWETGAADAISWEKGHVSQFLEDLVWLVPCVVFLNFQSTGTRCPYHVKVAACLPALLSLLQCRDPLFGYVRMLARYRATKWWHHNPSLALVNVWKHLHWL